MSNSSADFSLKFENVVRNNAKKCLFTIVQPMQTALWKGRAAISISVAIMEFIFKVIINHFYHAVEEFVSFSSKIALSTEYRSSLVV